MDKYKNINLKMLIMYIETVYFILYAYTIIYVVWECRETDWIYSKTIE